MNTDLRRPAWVLAAMVLLIIATASASLARRGGRSETEAEGVVTAVSGPSVPGTLTVRTSAGEIVVTVDAETEFELDDDEPEDEEGGPAARRRR